MGLRGCRRSWTRRGDPLNLIRVMPAKGESRIRARWGGFPFSTDVRRAFMRELAMRLIINGEAQTFTEVADVAALVAALRLDARKVAVERNLEIVPRSSYARARLADGDRIEIVHFVGGG
jgi:sulfur carrier protein